MAIKKDELNEVTLLKNISDFLDVQLEKAKNDTDDEDVSKAMKTKPGKKDEDEEGTSKAKAHEGKETKEEEELEEKEEHGKKCKKGDAEGGSDRISATNKETDKIGKKSLTDEEIEEYQMLKKSKEEADLKKAQEEKDEMKKSLSTLADAVTGLKSQIEELSKKPAREKRSVDGVSYMKKSDTGKSEEAGMSDGEGNTDTSAMPKGLFKAKVSNLLFEEGVKKGKLTSADVAEYEGTGFVSDPSKRSLIKSLVSEEIKKGSF
jgi:hypothetical protein